MTPTATNELPSEPADPALPTATLLDPAQSIQQPTDQSPLQVLVQQLATSYVRRENRFYHIDRPNEPLSRLDVELAFLTPASRLVPKEKLSSALMKQVFDKAIVQRSSDPNRCIPIWTGALEPHPGNPARRIQLESGSFVLNTWAEPKYRQLTHVVPSYGLFGEFFLTLFQRPAERRRVLDWLAWCLQHEDKKPNWAVMLYSAEKGTGKSTFCTIAEHLFGHGNTSVQNNIEKVAGKFNGPVLGNKLIVCEEVQLRPDSDVGNKLKTLITAAHTTSEHKGRNVEKVALFSCFLMNSNHLPLWLEAGERRVYVVDVGHEGHASGPQAATFSQLVKDVEAALRDDAQVAALYHALLQRKLADDFDPFSLNSALHGTEVMKRVLTSNTPATTQQLREFLGSEGTKAITEKDLRLYFTKEMRHSSNAIRHMMSELGWTRYEVKWGGVDYARAIWVAPQHSIDRGNIYGPNGYQKAVCDTLWAAEA